MDATSRKAAPRHIRMMMTPLTDSVFSVLTRLARVGESCPSNAALGTLAGGYGRSTIQRALKRLVILGAITIEIVAKERRIGVLGIGTTPWGAWRPNRPPPPRTRPRATPVVTLGAIGLSTAPIRLVAPPPRQLDLSAPDECQWLDEQGTRWHICGAPVLRGRSWCDTHYLRVCARPVQVDTASEQVRRR